MSSHRSVNPSIPSAGASLLDLFANCVVAIESHAAKKNGTGFFVAPRLVLTCRHTVDAGTEGDISVRWKRRPLNVTRRQFPVAPRSGDSSASSAPGGSQTVGSSPADAILDAVLLDVDAVEGGHPCVLLDSDVRKGDELYTFGFKDLKQGGAPYEMRALYFTEGGGLLKVVEGQVLPGLSGSPLLDLQTGAVCAMIAQSLDPTFDLGGYAVPVHWIFQAFPELGELNHAFHYETGVWAQVARADRSYAPTRPRRWAKPLLLAASLLGMSFDSVSAEPASIKPFGEWELRSPEWAFFRAIVTDPRDPSVVFAGLDQDQGVYRSRDDGKSWEPINGGLGSRFVKGIAASYFDQRLYAATTEGLWCSRDRGETWAEVEEFRGKSVLTVALSPHDPQLMLAGCQRPGGVSFAAVTAAILSSSSAAPEPPYLRAVDGTEGSGLKLSLDGGEHWKTFPQPETINSLWVDPEDSRVFAIASADDGLFFSRDGMERFRRIDTFPQNQSPLYVAIVPDASHRLLVGTTHGGLYSSDDDGNEWNRAKGIPDVQVSDIRFLKETPLRIVAASTVGVFQSIDGGKEWHRSTESMEYSWCMTMTPTGDGSLVVGTSGGGAYRRAAGGSAWNPSNEGFPPALAIRLQHANGWLFAGTSTGVWKSADKGGSWRFAGLIGEHVFAIALVSESSARQSAGRAASGGLFVSHTGGDSFDQFVRPGNQLIEVFAGTDRGKVYRSRDSGATWDELKSPTVQSYRTIRSITVSSRAPRRIGVVVEHGGFFLSDDDGKTWSADSTQTLGMGINLVERSVHREDALFAMTFDRGFFTSWDAGGSWLKAAGIQPDEIIVAVAQPRVHADVIFAASVRRGVYRSRDGGRNFDWLGQVPAEPGEDQKALAWASLAVRSEPNESTMLVLGSSRGSFLSRDEAKTWSPLAAGIHKNSYSVNEVLLLDDNACVIATDKGILLRVINTEP